MIEHIVYINLAKRTDRNQQMREQLSKHEIPFTRIEAIAGEDIEDKEFWLNRSNFRTMCTCSKTTLARVGCYLSHIKALQYIVDNNLDNVAILEDDAVLLDNFNKDIKVPADSFLTYLGFSLQKDDKSYNKKNYMKIKNPVYSSFAYFISQINANKMLKLLTSVYKEGKGCDKINCIISNRRLRAQSYDMFLIKIIQPNVNTYLHSPPFVTHSDMGSDISKLATKKVKFNI